MLALFIPTFHLSNEQVKILQWGKEIENQKRNFGASADFVFQTHKK